MKGWPTCTLWGWVIPSREKGLPLDKSCKRIQKRAFENSIRWTYYLPSTSQTRTKILSKDHGLSHITYSLSRASVKSASRVKDPRCLNVIVLIRCQAFCLVRLNASFLYGLSVRTLRISHLAFCFVDSSNFCTSTVISSSSCSVSDNFWYTSWRFSTITKDTECYLLRRLFLHPNHHWKNPDAYTLTVESSYTALAREKNILVGWLVG